MIKLQNWWQRKVFQTTAVPIFSCQGEFSVTLLQCCTTTDLKNISSSSLSLSETSVSRSSSSSLRASQREFKLLREITMQYTNISCIQAKLHCTYKHTQSSTTDNKWSSTDTSKTKKKLFKRTSYQQWCTRAVVTPVILIVRWVMVTFQNGHLSISHIETGISHSCSV